MAHSRRLPLHLAYKSPLPLVCTINAAAGEPALAHRAIVPLTADPSFFISVVYGTAAPGTRVIPRRHRILPVSFEIKGDTS